LLPSRFAPHKRNRKSRQSFRGLSCGCACLLRQIWRPRQPELISTTIDKALNLPV
jgi:hypothetical protein